MQVLKFLVVDDATFIRDMVKKQLRDAYPGCQIADAPSAVRAQVALKSQNFDLILCDWEMPEMSGEEFLRWLRAHPQHKDVPFIMVSSRGERDFIVKAVQAGVNDYLGKPFKPEMLIAKVDKVLRKAGKDLSAPTRGSGTGVTQGIAGASIAVLTGHNAPTVTAKDAAVLPAGFAPPAAKPKLVARGQAQLNFAGFNTQCVIKDISLQLLSGIIKREDQVPAILEPVVISIFETEGDSVARLNGYVHSIQAAENRIDATVLKLVIRFVDDDPAKLDLLSHYIEKL
ncbi:MAG TPA: response regulator [Spongiibacteraceae bacterium]|jgi:DNA-binding response OmpR family regulator